MRLNDKMTCGCMFIVKRRRKKTRIIASERVQGSFTMMQISKCEEAVFMIGRQNHLHLYENEIRFIKSRSCYFIDFPVLVKITVLLTSATAL